MKQVMREVKDFKQYEVLKNRSFITALIVAFFCNSIVVYAGYNSIIIVISFILITAVAYEFCELGSRFLFSGIENHISPFEFDDFLTNKGYDIATARKRRTVHCIPFSNKISYTLKKTTGEKEIFIFDLKENSLIKKGN